MIIQIDQSSISYEFCPIAFIQKVRWQHNINLISTNWSASFIEIIERCWIHYFYGHMSKWCSTNRNGTWFIWGRHVIFRIYYSSCIGLNVVSDLIFSRVLSFAVTMQTEWMPYCTLKELLNCKFTYLVRVPWPIRGSEFPVTQLCSSCITFLRRFYDHTNYFK